MPSSQSRTRPERGRSSAVGGGRDLTPCPLSYKERGCVSQLFWANGEQQFADMRARFDASMRLSRVL